MNCCDGITEFYRGDTISFPFVYKENGIAVDISGLIITGILSHETTTFKIEVVAQHNGATGAFILEFPDSILFPLGLYTLKMRLDVSGTKTTTPSISFIIKE